MKFKDLRAALRAQHLAIYAPGQPLPAGGWRVVVWPSEFHPHGWSIRVTDPHRIINPAVASHFVRLGYWVQWSEQGDRMEAWPNEPDGSDALSQPGRDR